MAFNLRSLGVRSLSALFFVALLLGSLVLNYLTFSLFFAAVALGSLHEFYNMLERMDLRPSRNAGFLCALIILLSALDLTQFGSSVSFSYMAFAVPPLALGAAVFSTRPNAILAAFLSLGGLVYCVAPFALLHLLVTRIRPAEYDPGIVLAVILMIWSNDTFAYLGGNLLGKRKMIERISPGKTWEGTLTGVVVTFVLSFVIPRLAGAPDYGTLWQLFGILVPVLATIGDLAESMLKRWSGVKDSGTIMPGHGGFLDRFDSLLFVVPVVTAFCSLLQLH